jgi:type IV secretory pathway TrbF-like protein
MSITASDAPPAGAGAKVDVYRARRRGLDGKVQRLERANRFLAFLLALSLAKDPITTWGLATAAAKPGATAWYVPVDRLGQVGTPLRGEDVPVPGADMIQAKIRKCIADLRLVYVDPIALGDRQREGRSCLRGDALTYVDRYFGSEDSNPFLLAAELTRRVDVTRVLQIKDGSEASQSWKVEWRETEVPRDANSGGTVTAWGAIVTVTVEAGRSDEEILANPSGVFITGLDWRADSAPRALPSTTTRTDFQ